MRLRPAARRRSARRAVAEALDDPRDPLAVEVLAGDDDDAAAAEVEGGRQNAAVPERHDRLPARGADRVEMLQALDAPAQRVAERVDQRVAERRRSPRPATRLQRDARQSSATSTHRRSRELITLALHCYMPLYCGPPPPSGGTQVITWYGSMMSHVLQCTQFDALICSRGAPSAVVARSRRRSPDRTHARMPVLRAADRCCRPRCAPAGATG